MERSLWTIGYSSEDRFSIEIERARRVVDSRGPVVVESVAASFLNGFASRAAYEEHVLSDFW